MKKITAAILCATLLLLFSSCESKEVQNPVQHSPADQARETIIADNIAVTGLDHTAGLEWITRYGAAMLGGPVSGAEYEDSFRTGALSTQFDVCFSKWNVQASGGQTAVILVEAVYADGRRYLSDFYELTEVYQTGTLAYACDRMKQDGRFASALTGTITNRVSNNVKEYNITERIPQSVRYTLLSRESIRDGKLYYGAPSDGKAYTVNISADVSAAEGLQNIKSCNLSCDDQTKSVYLMNQSYRVGVSEPDGHLVVVNRKGEQTILCERIGNAAENTRIPEIFDVYEDELLIYVIRSDIGIRGYGVYDSSTQQNIVFEDGSYPVALSGDWLYVQYVNAEGVYSLGYLMLNDIAAGIMALQELGGYESIASGTAEVNLSADGQKMVFSELGADGITRVFVLNAGTGALTGTYEITGALCRPRYAGFIDDVTVMVLCDRKFMCDEYMFLVSLEGQQ